MEPAASATAASQASSSMQLFIACDDGTRVVEAAPADTFGAVLHRVSPWLIHDDSARLAYGGRRCDGGCTLRRAGVQSGSVLQLLHRLRGGGGDGGATGAESRSSYLEMYMDKKPDKVNPREAALAKWTRCQLSGQPLNPPCVSDELGHLFNKDAVVTALMEKTVPPALAHISSLKHLIPLKLQRIHGGEEAARAAGAPVQDNAAQFCCPVTGQEMNGRFPFVIMRPTGHAISRRALREAPLAVEEHIGSNWTADDLLPVNGTDEEVETLREAVLKSRAAAKAAKLEKKAAKSAKSVVSPKADSSGAVSQAVVADSLKRSLEATVEERAAKKVKQAKDKSTVYNSIFLDKTAQQRETYACRSVGARYL